MGNSISMGVAYRDQDLDGSTIVNSSVNGATAAQSAFLAGATAGTQVASKAVIADSSVNIGATKVTGLYVGASGSEVATEGSTAVVTNSTTLGTLAAGGDSILSSSKISAFTLAAPLPGVTKRLFATHASTTAKTVTASSGVTFGGVATVITFGTSDSLGDQSITLRGLTTTLWGIAGKYGTTVPVTS
jgi:hypothetical protein